MLQSLPDKYKNTYTKWLYVIFMIQDIYVRVDDEWKKKIFELLENFSK